MLSLNPSYLFICFARFTVAPTVNMLRTKFICVNQTCNSDFHKKINYGFQPKIIHYYHPETDNSSFKTLFKS